MTLIAGALEAGGTRELPAPTRERFTPLRAGILNLWEFDEQEFWFEDGRLILRGANEAGKSKALEVLLPFLLDANIRPERLDPFGEKVKTMYWNLLEFDPDRKIAAGYTWLELGRLVEGEPRFATIGAGFRATRSGGRRVKSWYFVTPRRIGRDLALLDGRVPLPISRLQDALGDDGRVFDHPAEYREAVDRQLFGLGAERYGALVHLLLQLRRPHLSAKLDPGELSKVLSDSLPPLEESRVAALAQAFDRLDEEAEAVAGLEGAHRSIRTFRKTYSAYARQHARHRAAAVRASITNLDNVTRRVRDAEASRFAARKQAEDSRAERDRVQTEIARLRADQDALMESDEMRAAERLDELRAAAAAAEERFEGAGRHLREGEDDLAGARREFDAARQKADEARASMDAGLKAARAAASLSTMLPHHEATEEQFGRSPKEARRALDAMVRLRIDEVRSISGLEQTVREFERALAGARRREDEARERLELAEASLAAARVAMEDARVSLLASVAAWVCGIEDVDFGENAEERLIEDVLARIAGGQEISAAADTLLGPHLDEVSRRREDLLAGRIRLEDERADLDARREAVASERDDGPRPRPGVGLDREARPGAPLWLATDFAEELPTDLRAGLEAALEAAGLLDAWVTPEGELLDPATFDVFFDPGLPPCPAQRSLADVLIPTEHPTAGEGAVRRALRTVALVEAGQAGPEDGAWVATDGRWRLGPLVGRWEKDAPEHVGAGAREAARLRRLGEIDKRLEELLTQIAALDGDLEETDRRRALLIAAREEFPSDDSLRSARARLGAEVDVRDRADFDYGEACLRAREAERALEESRGTLQGAARDAGLLDHLGALDKLERCLGDYLTTLADLEGAAIAAGERTRRAGEILRRRDALEKRCEERRVLAEQAKRDAVARRSAAVTFAGKVGKSAREVLARREQVAAGIRAGEARREELDELRIEANRCAERAAEQFRRAEEDRAAREIEREDAVHALEFLFQTGLLALAMPNLPVEAEPPWNVTTATDLARRIEGATKSTETDSGARDRLENRVHNAFLTLRSDLGGDFGPSSSREEGLTIVTVLHLGRAKSVPDLDREIHEEIVKRRELLEEREREVIERHLLADVGHHLQELISSARRLVERMNSQLEKHRTNSGQRIRLRWDPSPDANPATRAALDVLRKDVRLLETKDRDALTGFLRGRIRDARETDGAGSSADRFAKALDYRNWHDFVPFVHADGSERRLTRKVHSAGSGGAKALLIHLPLFAAAAAHYGSARPEAPHLVLLDEAFAGIDPSQRGSLMGLLVAFDLDFMMTNHDEWGCYPELPGVAVYHLERDPAEKGVAALRFVWNGAERIEDDPYLRGQTGELPW